MNSVETLFGRKILYSGTSHNWLGDSIVQLVLEVTPGLALSICGPVHRADAKYGLPDVKDDRYDSGVSGMIQAMTCGKDIGYPDVSICVLKRLTQDEYPMIPENSNTGLRTLSCKCRGIPDQFDMVSLRSIPCHLATVEANAQTVVVTETRTIEYYTRRADLIRWGTVVYLDPTNPCSADPHPVAKPIDYVLVNMSMRNLLKEERLLGVYVWTEPDRHCHAVGVVGCPDNGFRLTSYGLMGELSKESIAELPGSFNKFYELLRRKYVGDRRCVERGTKADK